MSSDSSVSWPPAKGRTLDRCVRYAALTGYPELARSLEM